MTLDPTRRLAAVACLAGFVACAGGRSAFTPSAGSENTSRATHPMAQASPGNGASALPGSLLPCAFPDTPHQASCTLAININVPPILNPNAPLSLISGLTPADLRALYSLPSEQAGTTVAIVDAYDDPTAEADLNAYRTAFGLGLCTSLNGCLRKVNQRGWGLLYPPLNVNWAQETSLDLEMVSAGCPRCKLLLVEANSASVDDLGAGVDEAARLGARVVSNSYYAGEWRGETSEDVHYNHHGVAITVSSGDRGRAYYPAASPYVTAVGGTTVDGAAGNWIEKPWVYTGRGCSAYEPRPAFQKGPCATRAITDMATVADPRTGVAAFCVESGGWVVAGGTSVGAPLVAAAYALGKSEGPAYAYAHRTAFRDIPPRGYDLRTGLGTPIGIAGL